MKRLFSFSVFLVAMLFAASVFAQHVYIDDPCVGGKPGSAWNPNRISDIGAVTLSGKTSPWPAWFYDATGSIFGQPVTEKVQGLQVVESNIVRVDAEGELYMSMDIYAMTLKASSMRNFGARIRLNSGTEWDTIFVLRGEGENFPAYTNGVEGTYTAVIGDKYNGKSVIFQIFYYNDSIATDAFIVAFNNVFLASYGVGHSVQTELASHPFAYGNTYAGVLNCINQSSGAIRNVEYAYSVDGNSEKRQYVYFKDTLGGFGGSEEVAFTFDISDAVLDTTNQILMWPVSVDSQAYSAKEGDTLAIALICVDEAKLDQDYIPMMECFTSATCQPCREMNPYLNPVLAELKGEGKLNVVKYQMNYPGVGDKYYISGNGIRGTYYSVIGVPTLVFNGEERPLGGWGMYYKDIMNTLREKAEAAVENKSFFSIKVNTAEVNADSTVTLDFDVISHLPIVKRANVYAMVTEGTVRGNKVVNSEKEFHYVNMAFATSSAGKGTNFQKEKSVNFSYTVDMKKTNMEELGDLQVVIFVQDAADRHIYQSAGVVMGPGDAAAIEDEELAQVSVYPNPARNTVYVKGLEKAQVEIFDLTGRRVYMNAYADGELEVSLAAVPQGTYVVRIAQNGRVASRKLVVVK